MCRYASPYCRFKEALYRFIAAIADSSRQPVVSQKSVHTSCRIHNQ